MVTETYDPLARIERNPADRWIYRWGFEFIDKPTRTGGWFPATRLADMASSVNKTNLLCAFIEGKHWSLRDQIKIFARVPGSDFINFEHLAVKFCRANGTALDYVYGLRIQARNEIISCLDDGSTVRERRALPDNYVYPEWTRY